MYQVQFISSGIVAFSSHDKGLCQRFIECNNYEPETYYLDPDTGEVDLNQWVRGECLNLFKLVKAQSTVKSKNVGYAKE